MKPRLAQSDFGRKFPDESQELSLEGSADQVVTFLKQTGHELIVVANPYQDRTEVDEMFSHAQGIYALKVARTACSQWETEGNDYVGGYLTDQMRSIGVPVSQVSCTWEELSNDHMNGYSKIPRGGVSIAIATALLVRKDQEKLEKLRYMQEDEETRQWMAARDSSFSVGGD